MGCSLVQVRLVTFEALNWIFGNFFFFKNKVYGNGNSWISESRLDYVSMKAPFCF